MIIPKALIARLDRLAAETEPDEIIGRNQRSRKSSPGGHAANPVDRPFLRRWLVLGFKSYYGNVYYHYFIANDEDRALHDHPWANLSIVTHGRYIDHTVGAGGVHHRDIIREGQIRFRFASQAHRVELIDGKPCWSLFVTGPVTRTWGFHCHDDWLSHSEFHDRGGC